MAQVKIPGREELTLHLHLTDAGEIANPRLEVIGGPDLLMLAEAVRATLKGRLEEVPLPQGSSTAELLMRELLMRTRGEWSPPVDSDELCHCRVILRATVDQAIVVGAHTSKKVSEWTSASTACGTCRPDVEAMISYRLGRS